MGVAMAALQALQQGEQPANLRLMGAGAQVGELQARPRHQQAGVGPQLQPLHPQPPVFGGQGLAGDPQAIHQLRQAPPPLGDALPEAAPVGAGQLRLGGGIEQVVIHQEGHRRAAAAQGRQGRQPGPLQVAHHHHQGAAGQLGPLGGAGGDGRVDLHDPCPQPLQRTPQEMVDRRAGPLVQQGHPRPGGAPQESGQFGQSPFPPAPWDPRRR